MMLRRNKLNNNSEKVMKTVRSLKKQNIEAMMRINQSQSTEVELKGCNLDKTSYDEVMMPGQFGMFTNPHSLESV